MKAHLILSLALTSLVLTGCNTIKGLGEDISGGANWTQDKMSGIGGGGGTSDSTKSSDSQYVKNPPQFPAN